jgi:hypothetical protein
LSEERSRTGRPSAVLPGVESEFVRQKGVSEHLKSARVRFALCAAERVDRRTNLNVDEAAVLDHLLPGCTRQTTGNSGGPKIDVRYSRRGHRFAIGNIGELKVTTRFQNTAYLRECPLLIGA